ncbi:cytochrome P450 [Mycena leptocephala]|nr:cytochrome P450 [Mycena leptocephala]
MEYYATALAALISAFAVYLVFRRQSAIHHIAGPPCPSWIFGHMPQLLLPPRYGDHEFSWQKLYGAVYRIKGCFGQDRLIVSDPTALQYILNSPDFFLGPTLGAVVNLMFGESSVICARWDEHRRLRAGLNVGFTAAAVRNCLPVFRKVAETISEELEKSPKASTNVCPILSNATLGAVSEAVLGYSLQDLGEDFVANNNKIVQLAASQSKTQILADAIGACLPSWFWRAAMYLPTTAFQIIRKERHLTEDIGRRIVRDKKDAAGKGVEIDGDVFGLLLQNTPDDTRKLSEGDVVAQTALILVAGQETTANTIAWALLELARNPDFQEKLRAEGHSASGEGVRHVSYDNMPLLNALIKETLRLYPAGPMSERVALQDTGIPLADSIATLTGERIDQIHVQKGQVITLAIASYQRLHSRWGDDADTFNPSRWLDGTPYQGDAVGPYANLLSFLGGPRICLGWRFAILEMQVILCELVAKFSFAEPENMRSRPQYMNQLLPIVASGEKGLSLLVTRLL